MHVTIQNFETEVLEASYEIPVLVDFWAPWCGPCKTLGPLLDKVHAAYQGRFKLVKIDSDQQPQLAQAFGIRSIPTCILVLEGKPVDGFQGAVSEAQLKAFLDRILPSEEEIEALQEAQDAQALLAAGDAMAALHKLEDALRADPTNADARSNYVRLLIDAGQLDAARAALAPGLAEIPRQLRFDALNHLLDAHAFVHSDTRGQWDLAQFDTLIEADRRDFDTRLAKARVLMAAGTWTAAMDELLEIILRDKAWQDAIARKVYVAILELLTPAQPKTTPAATGKSTGSIELSGKSVADQSPQAQLVSAYRRKLSMALN